MSELDRRKRWSRVATLALLLAGVAAGVYFLGHRAKVNRVKNDVRRLTGAGRGRLSPEEQQATLERVLRELPSLSPRERLQVADLLPGRQQERERLRRFFELTPQEQTAQLDEDIDRSLERIRQLLNNGLAERLARAGAGAPRPGLMPGPGPGPPAPGLGPDAAPRLDPEEIKNLRKRLLDTMTPQERAQRGVYVQMMRERMRQRLR